MQRITEKAPLGKMVKVVCRHHPDQVWLARNFAPVGSHGIWHAQKQYASPVCGCPNTDLIPHAGYANLPDVND